MSSDVEKLIYSEEVDEVFLKTDEEDPDRYSKDHYLFDAESEPNDKQYLQKVKELIQMNATDWKDLTIFESDLERFKKLLRVPDKATY